MTEQVANFIEVVRDDDDVREMLWHVEDGGYFVTSSTCEWGVTIDKETWLFKSDARGRVSDFALFIAHVPFSGGHESVLQLAGYLPDWGMDDD